MKTMKFPKEYSLKVDVTKVNWEIMKEWSAQRVTQLLGMEDEVLIGYIHEQLGTDKKVSHASYNAYWSLVSSGFGQRKVANSCCAGLGSQAIADSSDRVP